MKFLHLLASVPEAKNDGAGGRQMHVSSAAGPLMTIRGLAGKREAGEQWDLFAAVQQLQEFLYAEYWRGVEKG